MSESPPQAIGWPRTELPRIVKVRQFLPADHLMNLGEEITQRLLGAGIQDRVHAGQRVAITAGSRGMGGFQEIVKAVVEQVQACGAEPFIVPAMGSHGGATAEGQQRLLAGLGISEQTVGCPIRPTMETVELGSTKHGADVHYDRIAYEADATIVLGRCKTHPTLHEGNGSGLQKMVTIGLGKQRGAQAAHAHGLERSVLEVAPLALARGNIVLGINVIENGYRRPHTIDVVPPEGFAESDQRCLDLARAYV
ncbi:MAG TPA: lactate racemase domain-containing protein, partial [Chloroflexota bacterium]|nr:lactate racemase domain-containing protein [Chloroflexota bacterium]